MWRFAGTNEKRTQGVIFLAEEDLISSVTMRATLAPDFTHFTRNLCGHTAGQCARAHALCAKK